jgi:hypothetical protein
MPQYIHICLFPFFSHPSDSLLRSWFSPMKVRSIVTAWSVHTHIQGDKECDSFA